MRNALVLLATLALLPVSVARPFLGIVAVTVYAYLRPQDLAWGVSGYRLTLLLTLATVVGVLFSRVEKPFRWSRLTGMMVLLWFLVAMSYLFADNQALALPAIIDFSKVIGLALLTAALASTQERCRLILWAIVGSLGLLALKGTVWSLAHGGALIGGPGGMIGDNNSLATAFVMMLPLAFVLAKTERSRRLRAIAGATVIMTLAAIVLTYSRGGFLGLLAAILVLWITARRKARGVLILLGLVAGVALVAPAEYYERVSSIGDTDDYDRSIQGRFQAWDVALKATADHPLTGVGYNNFHRVFPRYSKHPPRVTHNSYLQIASECGIPALVAYVGLFLVGIASLHRMRSGARGSPPADEIVAYSKGLEASLLGYMVCAVFLSFAQFDLFYQELALVSCLGRLPAPGRESDTDTESEVDSYDAQPWGRGAYDRNTEAW